MARYYFHLEDGEYLADEVGLDLQGMNEVRSEAIRSGAEILRDYGLDGWNGTEWRMNVVNEAGRTVFNLMFSATEPAS
jgi:hypothetical protein